MQKVVSRIWPKTNLPVLGILIGMMLVTTFAGHTYVAFAINYNSEVSKARIANIATMTKLVKDYNAAMNSAKQTYENEKQTLDEDTAKTNFLQAISSALKTKNSAIHDADMTYATTIKQLKVKYHK